MKTSLLFSFILLLSTVVFSQHIITYSQTNSQVGSNIHGELWGYKTHFIQADSSKLTFISSVDTVELWAYSHYSEEMIYMFTNNQFPSVGSYDLYVENSIDGVMYLPNAVSVSSPKYMQGIDVTSNWRFTADTTVDIQIWSYSMDFYPNATNYAYFFRPNQDTIFVDSVEVIGSRELTLHFSIDSNSTAGFYDLYVFKNTDTLISGNNAIFIKNQSVIQIDSLSPDSMNNLPPYPTTEITIYGSHTHFLADSNMIFPIWGTGFDSTYVINDSVMKAYIAFPIPVKQVVSPNAIVSLYNPTDGLLEYPIRFDAYGAIGDNKESYKSIICYPNPANNYLNIQSEEFLIAKDLSITIYSISGLKVYSKKIQNQSNIRLDIHDLVTGMYIVYIQDSKRKQVVKFIKQ